MGITIFEGLLVNENPLFLFAEVAFNLLIVVDFSIRVWLVGFAKFFKRSSIWNYVDAVVVVGCIIMLAVVLLNKQLGLLLYEELSEELLLIIWSVF